MNVCIVGAGSIGGFLGVRLARTGADVTLVARGAHLAALRRDGLTLIERDGSRHTHRLAAVERIAEAGPHDVVILALKAHQLEPVAGDLHHLFHADTSVVTMQNGIPYWYFHRHGGPHEGRRVESVDPSGALPTCVPASRVIGCVVYPACDMPAPGMVRHVEGERFPLGELDGSITPRVRRVSGLFESAGLKSPVLTDIRAEIWLKLWGNLAFNPISALSRATLDRICSQAETRALAAAMMAEAQKVAERLGITFRLSLERRIEAAGRVGAHKTSMLQDIESGRSTEIDALVGSVIELARLTEVPVPHLETMYACVRLLETTLGETKSAALAA